MRLERSRSQPGTGLGLSLVAAVARLHADGRVEHRTDPAWFTDYSRRPTVEWETQRAEAAE